MPRQPRLLVFAAMSWFAALSCVHAEMPSTRPPNIVLILCDNLGYGDVGCYGSSQHKTPYIDRLAREGMRLTDCYAASGVCTPSRAALLTGCYPLRVNMHESDLGGAVLQPVARKGLHPDEWTMAEMLADRGYATALIGKWHLGDQPPFLPTRQGFQEYLGIPYSDDMTPRPGKPWPPLPLVRGEQVIEAPVDRNLLTRRYTEAALDFMRRHQSQPFFVLLSHAMPGSTAHPFAGPEFQGRSANGAWGDSVEELDWSVGAIVKWLVDNRLDQQTLVLFASDNGAPRREPPQGSNLPLKGWGYTTEEGGMRVPLIAWWPEHVPAGRTCRELVTLMDLYPTFAHLASATLPDDRVIDGKDIRDLLFGQPDAVSPHEAFYYYYMDQFQAVRSGVWKLYLPVKRRRGAGFAPEASPEALYNLAHDIGEQHECSAAHPDIVARLRGLAERARQEIGDVGRPGPRSRPAGWVEKAQPLVAP